ncbi:hypothetical protein CERZMDRAFT_99789 [Cercospora zeae-maydis SCOH1-5]|uniref:G-patch domain-containing protein n=1 Tax=Cercospora zeae-maydis SCOH1-5 TaxID=717836 RepID=A0A6A6F9T5_9PEZI|nr:hypothetical protein CERZMDRAFT_99789 [Cercospora zeae-maydis SCOH1-5]
MCRRKSESKESWQTQRSRSSSPEHEVLFEGRRKPTLPTTSPPQQPLLTDSAATTGASTARAASSRTFNQQAPQSGGFVFSPQATSFQPPHGKYDYEQAILDLPQQQVYAEPNDTKTHISDVDAELLARLRAQLRQSDGGAPAPDHDSKKGVAPAAPSGNLDNDEQKLLHLKPPRHVLLKQQEQKKLLNKPSSTYTWAPISPFDRHVLPSDAPWEPDLSTSSKFNSTFSNPAKSARSSVSKASTRLAAQQASDAKGDEEPMTWETLPRAEDLPVSMPFGKKMLEKNGWKEGEGLGKKGEGRSKVVDLRLEGGVREVGQRGGVGS